MVKVCPNCGSPEITYSSTVSSGRKALTGVGLPAVYYCNDCNYEGEVILEMDKKGVSKTHFPHKKMEYEEMPKSNVETLKPIFMTCTLLFLLVMFLAFWKLTPQMYGPPKYYDTSGMPLDPAKATSVSIEYYTNWPGYDSSVAIGKTTAGEIVIGVFETPPDFGNSTGVEQVVGFIIHIFFIIFILGFLALMLAHHYKRSLRFL